MLNSKIFKMYDVRGIYGKEIDEKNAFDIGRAFVSFLNIDSPEIVIGRDGRKSSPLIFEFLEKGIIESGGRVINIGISNTPLLNFSVARFNYDGGIMVTASHNPPEFNGLKIIREKSLQLYGDDIQKIKEIVISKNFKENKGSKEIKNFIEDYVNHSVSFVEELSNLKVVLDCGNGVAAITAVPVFEKLKAETFFLYQEIDGSFPNHLPDPHDEKSCIAVSDKIREVGADIGVIFDGDADRCILLDENGKIVSTDHLLCLLAEKELEKHPNSEIYYDLRFSKITPESIKKNNGNPIMMRVGNPFYKEKIIKEGGILGAELSGHIMFKENFGIDDGLFALLKTLNIMKKENKKLSELLFPFKKYFQTEEINIKVDNKEKTIEKIKNLFKDGEEILIDGIYVRYKDWWFNLRSSNTEDLVRLRIEAETEDILEEKKQQIISLIKE